MIFYHNIMIIEKMQYSKDIRDFMREKRLATGKSLNTFAFDADIDPAILSRVENKKQGVKLDMLQKFVATLDMKLSDFFLEFEQNN